MSLAAIAIAIGAWLCPMFTLGAVMFHYDHGILGIIAWVASLAKYISDGDWD